jgi:hypothetical protein
MQNHIFTAMLLLLPTTLAAQEGHPFEGTWRGTIGSGGDARAVVIIMDYDGARLNGMIDPGRNSYRFEDAAHDAPAWTIDVSATTRAGEAIAFSAVLHDIGSAKRYLEGTWTQNGAAYPFKIARE